MKDTPGIAVSSDPRRNKGIAFTERERKMLGPEGLLPTVVDDLRTRVERVHGPRGDEAQRSHPRRRMPERWPHRSPAAGTVTETSSDGESRD